MLTRISRSPEPFRIVREVVSSPLLAGNPAGVDACRPLSVFVPEVPRQGSRHFPVLYCLAPWTSAGRQQFDWEPFREDLATRLSRLISTGKMAPCIVVCPDLFTSFGGSQYINSSFLGAHADHLVHELVPYIESQFPVLKGPGSRGVFGRSSGGFGALRLALDFPGTFAAVACHAGDMGFDLLYGRDLVEICYALARYSGDVGAYLKALQSQVKLNGKDVHNLMLLGMAASYSPDLSQPHGFRLPIDPLTGAIDGEVWAQWLAHDPLQRVRKQAEGLKALQCLYIDCGNRDQYHLQFGARQLRAELARQAIAHHAFEFDDNHSGTSYRYDISLPLLSQALQHDG